MSAILGRRACSIGGRYRFLLSGSPSRLLGTHSSSNTCSSDIFNQKAQAFYKSNHTTRNSLPSISSLLSEHQDTVDASNVAFLYRTAASVGQVLDPKSVRQILKILQSNKEKEKMKFTVDDIKEILQGHRYTDDKNKDVRLLLSEILPSTKGMQFDSQRKLGLSLFGLQNMTAFYPEIRKLLHILTHHMARCQEPLDGSCISGALFGTRSMNATESEVIHFIKVITKKINESPFQLSPSGISQSLNSLQCKNDKKPEVLQLLAVLNTRLEGVCPKMSAAEVCRSLSGLQVMSAQSPIVIDTLRLLTSRFVAKDVEKELTARDLCLALGSLKTMGCSAQETNFLMKKIDENIQKLTEPIQPKDLVVAFSGLKNMHSTQAGVPKLLSTLTNNMLLLLQSGGDGAATMPTFLFPNILRYMKNMRSDEIAVRNFLSIISDVLTAHKSNIKLTSVEYTMCMSGLQSMRSTEPTVRRFLSSLLNCYLQNSQQDASALNWSQICLILEGMSSMDNKSMEVRNVLELIAQNIERMEAESTEASVQFINTISSAMYSMRNMNIVSSGKKSMSDVKFIYSSLFEKLKERTAVASSNQGVGKKAMMLSLGSLTAISSINDSFSKEVMLFIVDMIKQSKHVATASPYSYEVSTCLEGICWRPASCEAADALLRSFLLALSPDTIRICEAEIVRAMNKMHYPKEEISNILKGVKNHEVIGKAELNAHFQKSVSLSESLISLQSSIKDCVNGDAVDIFWSSNLLTLIDTHNAAKFTVKDLASLLQSSCEFSQLFFNKHKRQAMPLRELFIKVSSSVLQEATPTFTTNFDDFYTVFCATHCLWSKSGNKHGDMLLNITLDAFKQSTFKLTTSDAAKVVNLLKKTNATHSHAERLLAILSDKIDHSLGSDTAALSSTEFVRAVRGLRYLLNTSANARQLNDYFIQRADQSDLVLDIDELKIAMCSVKNSQNNHEKVSRALGFFHSQLCKYDKSNGFSVPELVLLLSTLRFMDSSSASVCLIIEELQKKLPINTLNVPVTQELLCNFIQFFNNKQCEDSHAILHLRDYFIELLNISGKQDLSVFSVKVVEQMIALKAKRSKDVHMNAVYGNMATDIISPDHPQNSVTPNMFCIGLLGLDTLNDSQGIEAVALFCEKLSECKIDFPFRTVMLALSAVENCPGLHHNAAAMDLVLSALANKVSTHTKSTTSEATKIKFPSLLGALRSLALLSKTSTACLQMYPALTDLLALETFSHHRVGKVLETLEGADVTTSEVQTVLALLLARMQDVSAENYEKKSTLPIIFSLEKMDQGTSVEVVQELKCEVLRQFNDSSRPDSNANMVSIQDLKSHLISEGSAE